MTVSNKGFQISKYLINDDVLNDLIMTPETNENYKDDVISFNLYKIIDKTVYVPRFYGMEKLINIVENKKVSYDFEPRKTRFIFTKSLRKIQEEITTIAIDHISKYDGGILALCCGSGKTVIALKIAEILGLKTLVIVHKSFLQDQWCKRISQFTNARVGIIRQKKIDIQNKDIVVGMLQSISMIDYDESIFNDFGLCIVDECHHIGSRVFSNAFFKINCRYMLGLSATPNRSDGMTKILHMFLGETIYSLDKKNVGNVNVDIFHYRSTNKKYVEKTQKIKGKKVPAMASMITNLTEIRERNIFIYNIINSLRRTPERKILILSGRTSLLDCLKNIVDKKILQEENEGILEKGEIKTYYYIGKLKQNERFEAEQNADILFATYEMAQEGLDIDRLNAVILITPKSDIVQSIGRIMRKETSGLPPLIIDIVDDISVFPAQGNKRRAIYEENNYEILDRYVLDDNVITKREYYESKFGNVISQFDNENDAHIDEETKNKLLLTDLLEIYNVED